MKKLALALVVGIALLSFVVSVHAEGTESYYYSGDFLTKEWKEKMEEKCLDGTYGDPDIMLPWMGQDPPVEPEKGCPGHLGNKLEIKGQGFEFKDAVLVAVGLSESTDCDGYDYEAVYEGGKLKLKDEGPWLDGGEGELVDEDVTAKYCVTPTFAGGELTNLSFKLVFGLNFFDKFNDKVFSNGVYDFTGTYDGNPSQKLESDGSF